jgi:glycosyltransferase involved in cell wall biosynthesis
MIFFFDARYIRTKFHDGISRYTHELCLALYSLDQSITFLVSDEKQLALLPKGVRYIKIHAVDSWKEPFTSLILNKYHPDVVASPLQTLGSLGRRFKLILNQQDMTYYSYATPPLYLSMSVRLLWRLYHLTYWPGRWTLNAADIVATVSHTSKQEIEKAKLTKRPIIVVPNAARDLSVLLTRPVTQLDTPPKNLIYMGAFTPYKNVQTLIAAMEYLPGRTLHLLSRITNKRKTELEQLVPENATVIFHNGVSDTQYAALLANDAIMVSASRSEGYGLPIAEALKLGIPAVITDMAVFHEVAGEGALFANPDDPKDFAKKIQSLNSINKRKYLSDIGKKQIETFSWNHSAKTLYTAATQLVER